MRLAAYVWCALSVASLAYYAMSGQAFWVKLDPQTDGLLRFILLTGLHIGGPMSVLVIERKL